MGSRGTPKVRAIVGLCLLASLAVLVLLSWAGSAGAKGRRRHSVAPVAVLNLSARVLPDNGSLVASERGSRIRRGDRVRHIVIRFGDGSAPVLRTSLRARAVHHYRHPGIYDVRVTIRTSRGSVIHASKKVVVLHRRAVTLRRGTLVVGGSRVASAFGVPASQQSIIILRAGSRIPRRGRAIVVLPRVGAKLPNGYVGKVNGASRNVDGTVTITTTPASLGAAYSRFSVALSERLAEAHPMLVSSDRSGRLVARAASLSALPFTCTTSGGYTIDATANLSATHVDASLDIYEPAIHFLFTFYPSFTLGVSFTGSAHCSLDGDLELPVAVSAPLAVTIQPVFDIDASGSLSASTTWSPRMAIGFDRAPGISDNPIAFGSSITVNAKGNADVNVFAALSIGLSVGGRLGVTGTAGPEIDTAASFSTNGTSGTACASVVGYLKADLTANASVFVKSWSWSLFSGEFDRTKLYSHCATTAGGTGGSSGAPIGGGTGTGGPGGGGTGGGGTPSPPAGASISASQGGQYGCGSCSALNIQVHDFPTGTYTYYCHDNSGAGGSDTVFYSHPVTVTSADQSTWPGVFCDDSPPFTAYLVMDGVRSNSVTFSGSSSPPPPPTTYAETPGSVVHTWTDYADAGGTEGPTIPSNQTVQITCKVTGFQVADGDTWWYRIASSPWSNGYYGSADAFYNNGQTSGSLLGTPSVDGAVPNC